MPRPWSDSVSDLSDPARTPARGRARAIEGEVLIRDSGLLQSALARPQTSAFGVDAYISLPEIAAALLHSWLATTLLSMATSDCHWLEPSLSSV